MKQFTSSSKTIEACATVRTVATPYASYAGKFLTRWEIISKVDVLVDGEYIDEQRDTTLKWRGSKNQRVIDVQRSLKEEKIIKYAD